MAVRNNVWYFGKEDEAEVKKFSREISILFKVNNYDPECDDFFDYFAIGDFFFIPCIMKIYEETEGNDYYRFEEEAIKALNSAYDSSVKISFADLEECVKESGEEEDSVVNLLTNALERRNREIADVIDFIVSCKFEIKQNFVDFLFN